jgi:TonB family protein
VTVLIGCTFLFGQNSSNATDSTDAENQSAAQSETEHGVYVSGFEVLNRLKDPNVLRFYPQRVLAKVRKQWYSQIRELQASNVRRGVTVIEFEILEDGSINKIKTVESAEASALDTAASQAISLSAPFPRLPVSYNEKSLTMRMHFGYEQPASLEAPICNGPNWGAHSAAYNLRRVGGDVIAPKAIRSPDPEYSEDARRQKYMSTVLLAGTVDPQGSFADLCVVQAAGYGLDEKAIQAVSTWKFEPATLQEQPVAVRINVEVTFQLY